MIHTPDIDSRPYGENAKRPSDEEPVGGMHYLPDDRVLSHRAFTLSCSRARYEPLGPDRPRSRAAMQADFRRRSRHRA
jgi:hypothetical protein